MTAPSPGRRGRRRSVEHLRRDLSDRDLAILADLRRVRLLTGRLIQRLHFSDGSPLTAARKTRSTLQRLAGLGVVARLERRIGGVRAGSSGYLYGLSALGQRVMDASGPAGGSRRRRPWEPSRQFAEHVLAVSELYVGLREAETTSPLELLVFDAEPAAWRHWQGLGGEAKVLKPDAYVEMAIGDIEHLSFIEVDRGTESLNVIKRKAGVYVDFWQSGVEQHTSGAFPRVLWLTLDDRRAEQITDALSHLDPETWQLFQVGRLDRAVELLTDASTNQQNERRTNA